MALPEPGWVNGDDIARGLIDEDVCDCPSCFAPGMLVNGTCGDCYYFDDSEDRDYRDEDADYDR